MHLVHSFFQKLVAKIKAYPGLSLLIFLLLLVDITALKPSFYLIGWDNYSSYFNLPTNIFRTFFATWREYRGLGVPSDSESTDLFRQLFDLILKPIAPEQTLDQLYYLFVFNFGVLGMYWFAKMLYEKYIKEERFFGLDQIFPFFAAFFYAFNLNTLSVFYFPIIPFVTRFFAIPWLFIVFFQLLNQKGRLSWKQYVLYIAVIFFASGSYVTGTVFITIVMSLGIFGVLQWNWKRFVVICILFVGVNMFWLMPFANYTKQKSGIIRLAPTFVDANEVLLNKAKSYFSSTKQMELLPNFFEMQFTNTKTNTLDFFHPLAYTYNKFPTSFILFLFPLLYLIGCVCIFFVARRKWLLWIPVHTSFFLFLSLKEFSPLGFIYAFLNSVSPYFGVIFRFGDTKFHAFIAFSGSLAAAFAIVYLLHWLLKYKQNLKKYSLLLLAIIIIPTLIVYKDYFIGNFIGFFMYNKIPKAYFEIAKIINADPEDGRVAHLPMDRYGYWKSYSWGLFGSSFLNFFLDKPIIDKTFEPGSMENAYLHKRISDIEENFEQIEDAGAARQRAQEFYNLLQQVGVEYVIMDGTVSVEVPPRSIVYWGTMPVVHSQKIMKELELMHKVDVVKTYPVNLSDYMTAYKGLYPLRGKNPKDIQEKSFTITLYKLHDTAPKVSFVKQTQAVDPTFKNIFETNVFPAGHYNQDPKAKDYILYPFQRRDAQVTVDTHSVNVTVPNELPKGTVQVQVPPTTETESSLVEVTAKKDSSNLIITLYRHYLPTINDQEFKLKLQEITIPLFKLKSYMTDDVSTNIFMNTWHETTSQVFSNLRLRIDGTVLPIASAVSTDPTYLGSVITHSSSFAVELLGGYKTLTVDPSKIVLTDNPNCYGDKLLDYTSSISRTDDSVTLFSKNGSTCSYVDLTNMLDSKATHLEVSAHVSGASDDHDDDYSMTKNNISKPLLKQTLLALPKPNSFNVCIKERNIDDCYNNYQLFNIAGDKDMRISADRPLKDTDLLVFFSLKNIMYQEQTVVLQNVNIDEFQPLATQTVTVPPLNSFMVQIDNLGTQDLKLTMPKALSEYASYGLGPVEGYLVSNGLCDKFNAYRTFRTNGDKYISYTENCSNQLFKRLPFSSNNFYVWHMNYYLGSGQFPKYIFQDGWYRYDQELMSLYQQYPDVPGFKKFENPEFFVNSKTYLPNVSALPEQSAFTYVNPYPEYQDTKPKDYLIQQNTENEGMFSIGQFDVAELPSSWNTLTMQTGENVQKNYNIPSKVEFSQILPSLWKVKVTSSNGGTMQMQFNEAYDKQWNMHSSLFGALLGLKVKTNHTECDGYANCFEFNQNAGTKTYYLLYSPEKLNFLGWAVTALVVFVFTRLWVKKRSTI